MSTMLESLAKKKGIDKNLSVEEKKQLLYRLLDTGRNRHNGTTTVETVDDEDEEDEVVYSDVTISVDVDYRVTSNEVRYDNYRGTLEITVPSNIIEEGETEVDDYIKEQIGSRYHELDSDTDFGDSETENTELVGADYLGYDEIVEASTG